MNFRCLDKIHTSFNYNTVKFGFETFNCDLKQNHYEQFM